MGIKVGCEYLTLYKAIVIERTQTIHERALMMYLL
jgi:hypothetical protein